MVNVEKSDDLIVGSGIAGKFTAWTRDSCRRTGVARCNPDSSDNVRRAEPVSG
jgi:hypothetical protein